MVVLDIATVERTVAIAMDKGRYGEVGGGSRCFLETVDSNLGCRKLCRCDLESILRVNILNTYDSHPPTYSITPRFGRIRHHTVVSTAFFRFL